MFEKYDIDDLYLAIIDVLHPGKWPQLFKRGELLLGSSGYGYLTVLAKYGDKYYDLKYPDRVIIPKRDPEKISYIVNYIEPLSSYYPNESKNKEAFIKRKVIKMGEKHFNTFQQKCINDMQKKLIKKREDAL